MYLIGSPARGPNYIICVTESAGKHFKLVHDNIIFLGYRVSFSAAILIYYVLDRKSYTLHAHGAQISKMRSYGGTPRCCYYIVVRTLLCNKRRSEVNAYKTIRYHNILHVWMDTTRIKRKNNIDKTKKKKFTFKYYIL